MLIKRILPFSIITLYKSFIWIRTFLKALGNLLITSPGNIYYGMKNVRRRNNSGSYKDREERGISYGLKDNNKLILFVHGKGGHWSNFDPLIDFLHSHLYDMQLYRCKYDLLPIDLGHTHNTSIREDAYILHSKILEIRSKHPRYNEIILIGLSKGGLVAMYYVSTYLIKENIDPLYAKESPTKDRIYTLISSNITSKVITISSPLQGTETAYLLKESSLVRRELEYHSRITMRTKENLSNLFLSHPSINFYHIIPTWDHLIIPGRKSSSYDFVPKRNTLIYKGYKGHVGILYSREVSLQISKWIKED